ncbi:hypothetical protein TSUD_301740 [Trifolium subterraneum]|uniref:Reverse transcriptase zinc-binding domain-containing protein n=1 Tax=Trifolium subterraneum TaxID=3900 RepID=A0A2Z6PPM7_TRISU|nr:hypothetical protein TSUD_301740 [Trifolium subterraneum]
MKQILNDYEKASGQAINYAKSEVYFSRNTPANIKSQITATLGVSETMGTGRYLGMPSMIGRNKKAIFGYLKDRMWKRIQGWSGKHLSKAGREVLVKQRDQLVTVEKLTMRKEHGGMGFRHLYGFNLAMLGKQGWHLVTNQDTILAKVFKAKYYPNEGFLNAKLGHNPSYVWRSIHASQVIVKRGLRWRIGNGDKINVWSQPWLRKANHAYVTTNTVAGHEQLKVAGLINHNEGKWDVNLVQQLFNQNDTASIFQIPLQLTNEEDVPIWRFSRNGKYSVRSAYYQLMEVIIDNNHLREEGNWTKLWKLNVPNKVKIFLWRSLRGCLPVKERLIPKGVQCDSKCICCDVSGENEWHCFFGCKAAQEVWIESEFWESLHQKIEAAVGFKQLVFSLIESMDSKSMAQVAMLLWTLWWRRNQLCWNDKLPSVFEVRRRARDALEDWLKVRGKGTRQQPIVTHEAERKWCKPQPGTLKCNIDAACFVNANQFCIGACIRDADGDLLAEYPYDRIVANINLMTDFGVCDSAIATLFHNRTSIFGSNDLIKSLEEVKGLGFNPSKTNFGIALMAKKGMGKKLWDEKVDTFKKWGWSAEAVFQAFRSYPNLMCSSIDKIEDGLADLFYLLIWTGAPKLGRYRKVLMVRV